MGGRDGAVLERIAFVGEVLGPFYLQDPAQGNAAGAFGAFAALDVPAAAGEWPFVQAAAAELALAQMQAGLAGGAQADDLVWEYRRLFVGPGAKPAPPWGSVYTDRECVIFGKSTLALRRWMRERGVRRLGADGANDPEDHIGLMLLLMSWIADHRPELLDEYLRLHLLTWADHFLARLAGCARQPFYKGLACLTRASLEGIRQARGLEVARLRFYR